MLLFDSRQVIAGANAGVIGTLLGFPFDTVKTTMQITHKSVKSSVLSIYSESGVLGFYKGVGSPLVALTILNTLNFSSYSRFCNLLGVDTHLGLSNKLFEWKITLAAALVGPIASLISTPFELVKTQMQLSASRNSNNPAWRNSFFAATDLMKRNGFLSLYLGHSVNTTREIVFLSTYFTVYEHIKYYLAYSHIPVSIRIPFSGGFAGAIGWFVSFPLDLIKSNIQQQNFNVAGKSRY